MSSSTTHNGTGNRLLDRLPRKEYKSLLPQLETIFFAHKEEVCHQNSPLSHVYFPTNGVFSTIILMQDGDRIEATAIGREGMVGVSAVLGLDFNPVTTVLLVPGECLRLPAPSLWQAMKPGRQLDRLLRRYAAYSLRNAECEAVGRLQRPAFGGRAHVPVAVDDAGSCGEGRVLAHPRVASGNAGRAPPVRCRSWRGRCKRQVSSPTGMASCAS